MARLIALVAGALLLAGCATGAFPPEMRKGVNQTLSLAELRQAPPGVFLQQRVILGGEILETSPQAGETEIEVLGRPLQRDDRPAWTDYSDGRFLIRSPQFLDPAVYAKGRRLTVLGTVAGEQQRAIGGQPYTYPVIASEQIRLWPNDPPLYAYPAPYPWFWGAPGWAGLYPGPSWYRPWWPYWW